MLNYGSTLLLIGAVVAQGRTSGVSNANSFRLAVKTLKFSMSSCTEPAMDWMLSCWVSRNVLIRVNVSSSREYRGALSSFCFKRARDKSSFNLPRNSVGVLIVCSKLLRSLFSSSSSGWIAVPSFRLTSWRRIIWSAKEKFGQGVCWTDQTNQFWFWWQESNLPSRVGAPARIVFVSVVEVQLSCWCDDFAMCQYLPQ